MELKGEVYVVCSIVERGVNPFNGIERLRYDDHRFWRDKGGSIAVVALTSDAMVKEVRSRVGPKVNWAHMWNLDYVSTGGASEEVEHRC
jgi:hypothetical protein